MRTVDFGKQGPAVSVIGQGTWYFEQLRQSDAVAALRHGVSCGLTHIDTAEMYGDGIAEEIVGEAIVDMRDEVFLVSKVLPWNASYEGTIAACETSLRRLQTDSLDSYLLHWPGSHPLEGTFAAMDQLQRDGKIKSFGVSNFDVDDLEDAVSVVGEGRLSCNQVLYHLETRAIEHEVLPWCTAHGISVVGYSPFGHDAFPDTRSLGWSALQAIAEKHGKSERQVALAFLARSGNVFLIPKSANSEHLTANAEAAAIELDVDDIERIDAAFPLGHKPAGLPML
ncbi:MAG: diketogulonate reductase-like aldo/keto reductase [Hyphomicrobiaceae bacterium]|jgi:diketogulonate reductase-like aldo/keto reductase